MAMQNYLVYRSSGDLDILAAPLTGYVNPLASFDDRRVKGTTYDVVIASAHDRGTVLNKSKDSKLVVVISYIPSIDDQPEDWATFYTNMCVADAYACDHFLKKALEAYTFPLRRWISLEGCHTLAQPTVARMNNPGPVKLYCLDKNRNGWGKLADFVYKDPEQRFQTVSSPGRDVVGIAFFPIAPTLADYMNSQLKFMSVAYDSNTVPYLDARQCHAYGERMERLQHMPGQATAKPIKDLLTNYTAELLLILGHTNDGKDIYRYSSNANIYDRVFMELNRSI